MYIFYPFGTWDWIRWDKIQESDFWDDTSSRFTGLTIDGISDANMK